MFTQTRITTNRLFRALAEEVTSAYVLAFYPPTRSVVMASFTTLGGGPGGLILEAESSRLSGGKEQKVVASKVGRKQIPIVRCFAFCYCLLSAYCLLFTQNSVVLIIVIQVIFFHDIQLYRIESDHLELDTAFLTETLSPLSSVRIHMDIRITLGTCSSRALLYLQRDFAKASDTSDAMR